MIGNDFNSNSELQITIREKKLLDKEEKEKKKNNNTNKYRQIQDQIQDKIQDPGLNTLAEVFLKYIYIVDLI